MATSTIHQTQITNDLTGLNPEELNNLLVQLYKSQQPVFQQQQQQQPQQQQPQQQHPLSPQHHIQKQSSTPPKASSVAQSTSSLNNVGLEIVDNKTVSTNNHTNAHSANNNSKKKITASHKPVKSLASNPDKLKKMFEMGEEDAEPAFSKIDYDEEEEGMKEIKDCIFGFIKDVIFNMILCVPGLRTKLDKILKDPAFAIKEIERIFCDFKHNLTMNDLIALRKYISIENTRVKIINMMKDSFNNIMADGKIDVADAPHFIALVHNVVKMFNSLGETGGALVSIQSDTITTFIHFMLKCMVILTLDGNEEILAVGLLESSFKLITITVLPLMKKGGLFSTLCCCFRKNTEPVQ